MADFLENLNAGLNDADDKPPEHTDHAEQNDDCLENEHDGQHENQGDEAGHL